MQKVYLLQLMPGWVYFNKDEWTLNEKLVAAYALLVQSGALLVSHNCFINFSAIIQC